MEDTVTIIFTVVVVMILSLVVRVGTCSTAERARIK
jgi:hypothetical protein